MKKLGILIALLVIFVFCFCACNTQKVASEKKDIVLIKDALTTLDGSTEVNIDEKSNTISVSVTGETNYLAVNAVALPEKCKLYADKDCTIEITDKLTLQEEITTCYIASKTNNKTIVYTLTITKSKDNQSPPPSDPTTPTQPNTENDPTLHDHVFGEWTTVTEPTCVNSGLKKRSCDCGQEETEVLPATGIHTYDEDFICSVCDIELQGTEGLRYALTKVEVFYDDRGWVIDHDAYAVIGYDGKEEDIVIPSSYNGLPIEIIGDNTSYPQTLWGNFGFLESNQIKSLTFSKNIKQIYAYFNLSKVNYLSDLDSWCSIRFSDYGENPFNSDQCYNYDLYIKNALVKKLIVPNTITEIGSYQFSGASISEVVISEGIKEIYRGAFYGCSYLQKVTIPQSLEYLSDDVFINCSVLHQIEYAGNIESWCNIDKCSYREHTSLPFSYELLINGEIIKDLVIPDTVEEIKGCAFYGMRINSVVIPDSVTSIGSYAFSHEYLRSVTLGKNVEEISEYAFSSCYGLVEIYNYSSLDLQIGSEENGQIARYALDIYTESAPSKMYVDDNGYVLYKENNDNIRLITYTGNEKILTLPDGITVINKYAFTDSCVVSVTLPDSLQSIEEYAFAYCLNLVHLVIGQNVTYIDPSAFEDDFWMIHIVNKSNLPINNLTLIGWEEELNDLSDEERQEAEEFYGFPLFDIWETVSGEKDFINTLTVEENGVLTCQMGKELLFMGYVGTSTTMDLSVQDITILPDSLPYVIDNINKVILPRSLRKILYDALIFCENISEIIYLGTIEEWETIEKAEDWDEYNSAFYTIYCLDGEIERHIHCYEWVTIQEPSCEQYGEKLFTCTICGLGRTSHQIEPLSHVYGEDGICTLCGKERGLIYENIWDEYYRITGYDGIEETVVIPQEYKGKPVTGLDDYAFQNSTITSLVVPASITFLDIYDCSTLEELTLAKEIEYVYIAGCDNLRVIYYAGTTEEWSQISSEIPSDVSVICCDTDTSGAE